MVTVSKTKNGYLVNEKEINVVKNSVDVKNLSCNEQNALLQFMLSESRGIKIKSTVS